MAPTPADGTPDTAPISNPTPTNTSVPKTTSTKTSTIVAATIFGLFLTIIALSITIFLLHRRKQRKKLPKSHRTNSYRPFRTNSDKSGLLANAAPVDEDDKSSMFSRDRTSSLALYVPEDLDTDRKRASMETVNLIPLRVTPAEDEVDDPLATAGMGRHSSATSSSGSGVVSRSLSPLTPTLDTPVSENGDFMGRKTRNRSSSTASVRYYDQASRSNSRAPSIRGYEVPVAPPVPVLPAIVHSPPR